MTFTAQTSLTSGRLALQTRLRLCSITWGISTSIKASPCRTRSSIRWTKKLSKTERASSSRALSIQRHEYILIAFDLDNEVGEFTGSVEQYLMGGAGRDANNVSGRELPPDATLNCAVALLVGLHGLPANHGAADD